MGIVSISLSQNNNMKFLLVVAVAAYVKAEADPALVYSTAGVVPSVYTHGVLPYAVHHPLVYAAPLAAGCQNDQGKLVPCAHGALPLVAGVAPAAAAAEPVEAVESVEKREAEPTAEADAEADPWLLYSGYHGYGYGHYAPFTYSYAPHVYSHAYSYYGLPHAYYYGKRSADAEPEADADAYYGYYGYARPYAYGLGYARYGYGYPYGYGYAWGK